MREFFIGSFEKLVAVIVVLLCIATVIGALAAASEAGAIGFVVALIAGGLYTILIGGMMYLALGIYHNTRRTAEATEKMANR